MSEMDDKLNYTNDPLDCQCESCVVRRRMGGWVHRYMVLGTWGWRFILGLVAVLAFADVRMTLWWMIPALAFVFWMGKFVIACEFVLGAPWLIELIRRVFPAQPTWAPYLEKNREEGNALMVGALNNRPRLVEPEDLVDVPADAQIRMGFINAQLSIFEIAMLSVDRPIEGRLRWVNHVESMRREQTELGLDPDNVQVDDLDRQYLATVRTIEHLRERWPHVVARRSRSR